MNAQGLAEIGSWLAAHGQLLIHGQPQTLDAAREYWTASKCRLQRWSSALRLFARDLERSPEDAEFHNPWPAMQIVVQEILISELLTRVWSAMLVSHDWKQESDELQGIAHSVHIGHLEARNRAVRTMLAGRGLDETTFDRLNQLRCRIERWTDLLLSQLPACEQAQCFAFDAARVSDFRGERKLYTDRELQARHQVLSASLHHDLRAVADSFPANPELNSQIAAGVIACFASDRFTSQGLPKSTQLLWMEKSQEDTRFFVEQLVDLEQQSEQYSMSQFVTRRVG